MIALRLAAGIFLLASTARAGVHIGNGGGLSESNFAYAYIKSESILRGCLETPSRCFLSDQQRGLASEILNQLPAEQQTQDQLRFKSPADDPDFFRDGGTELTARTGSEVGSLIYVNLDHIYPVSSQGHKVAVPVDFAVKVLMKSFGSHVVHADPVTADQLAARLAEFARGRTSILEYGTTGLHYIKPLNRPTMTLVTAVHEFQSYLMFADADTAYELTGLVRGVLRCGDQPVQSFTLKNMYWKEALPDWDDDTLYLQLSTRSSIRCPGASSLVAGPEVRVGLRFNRISGKYILDAERISVQ